MEIITGVERRRRWRCEEKLRIVAEAGRPGASFNDVARRHEVSRAWFRIRPFWVTRGARKPPACEGRIATGRMGPMREAASLPASSALGLKRSQA